MAISYLCVHAEWALHVHHYASLVNTTTIRYGQRGAMLEHQSASAQLFRVPIGQPLTPPANMPYYYMRGPTPTLDSPNHPSLKAGRGHH